MSFIFLSTIPACDSQEKEVAFRGGEECDKCMIEKQEALDFDLKQYLAYDFSLGMMLSCLATGSPEDECKVLVIEAGGQLDTYAKWVQVNVEMENICDDVCA